MFKNHKADLKILRTDSKSDIKVLSVNSKLEPRTHLPRVIGFQLDGGQRSQACSKAHPFLLDQSDAVQYDAVRQNQSHECPAHGDQDYQTTIHTKDQGSVLWVKKRGQRQRSAIYNSESNATQEERC